MAAISTFNSELGTLKSQVAYFESLAHFNPTLSTQEQEESHKLIYGVYEKVKNEITSLQSKISVQTTVGNQDEMITYVIQISELETKIQYVITQFNESILTRHSTIQIDYQRCIGPIEAGDQNADKRLILGDGNCFLYALTASYLEKMVQENTKDQFCDLLFSINDENLRATLFKTIEELNSSTLESILQNSRKILPFVNFFRQLTANEIKSHSSQYKDFLLAELSHSYHVDINNKPFDTLVDQHVLKMGTDFCHPTIQALCTKLNFPIKIFDSRIGNGLDILKGQSPKATFCREGDNHYFVLYPKRANATSITTTTSVKPKEIIVECKLPMGHNLFIRGTGTGLSWDKGIPLILIGPGLWVWRSDRPIDDNTEYKFLVDDECWENFNGNHRVSQGKTNGITPHFNAFPAADQSFTRITVHCATGDVEIRGTSSALKGWNNGITLKRIPNSDLYIWESNIPFMGCEYKILRDKQYESGSNHKIEMYGQKIELTPRFN